MIMNPDDFNKWLARADFGESVTYCIEKGGEPKQTLEGRQCLSAAHNAFKADLVALFQRNLKGYIYEYIATRISRQTAKKIDFVNSRELKRCNVLKFRRLKPC